MVPELIIAALFLGWILRGKFGRLADVQIRYAWMILVPLGLHFAAVGANYAHAIPSGHWLYAFIHLVKFGALMVVAVANRRIPGAIFVFAGLAINFVAIAANGGFMPAAGEAMRAVSGKEPAELAGLTTRHMLIGAQTKLAILCDVIAAKWPFVLLPAVYSIGDLITSLGALTAIVAIMRNPAYSAQRSLKGA